MVRDLEHERQHLHGEHTQAILFSALGNRRYSAMRFICQETLWNASQSAFQSRVPSFKYFHNVFAPRDIPTLTSTVIDNSLLSCLYWSQQLSTTHYRHLHLIASFVIISKVFYFLWQDSRVSYYIYASPNDYDGRLGARISAVFVILVVSTAVTFFPVLSVRVRWLKIPLYVYLFARYFGAGVIIATAFIHLLDPAYGGIGPSTCVGSSPGWSEYSWPPAIALTAIMMIFLLDFVAERYVEVKYGYAHGEENVESVITDQQTMGHHDCHGQERVHSHSPQHLQSGDQDNESRRRSIRRKSAAPELARYGDGKHTAEEFITDLDPVAIERSFRQQIAAFLILEFGVIVHSVIIGLNLGVVGAEFKTLYPVLVFHQSFEGLGIGARLSAIAFPQRLNWMPWALCAAYGLTTPISIAIGLGLRTTYSSGSFTAKVVSGVLDSVSAGILMYTGLVELLARDFLFNPTRTNDKKRLSFMLICLFLGTGIMALLGKWA